MVRESACSAEKVATYVCIIGQIRTRLVSCSCGRRGLPSRNVDSVEILGHLSDHDWVKTTVGEACILVLHADNVSMPY